MYAVAALWMRMQELVGGVVYVRGRKTMVAHGWRDEQERRNGDGRVVVGMWSTSNG